MESICGSSSRVPQFRVMSAVSHYCKPAGSSRDAASLRACTANHLHLTGFFTTLHVLVPAHHFLKFCNSQPWLMNKWSMTSRSKVQKLLSPNPSLFRYSYSPKYHPSTDAVTQRREKNPLFLRNQPIFQQREQIGLWYFSRAVAAVSTKRLPRSYARRKLLLAFQDSLYEHHLDSQGIAQRPDDTSHKEPDDMMCRHKDALTPISLSGTLQLYANKEILRAKHHEITAETGKLVEYLMQQQRWSP